MQNPRAVKIAKVDQFIFGTMVKFEFLVLDIFVYVCCCSDLVDIFFGILGKSGSKQEGF